jgi:hypothetical protein
MKRRTYPGLLALAAVLVLILLAAPAIQAQIGGDVDLSWRVLAGGGASASSGGNVTLGGSLGQFGAGSAAGGRVALAAGFWNPASAAPLAVTLASFTAEAQPGYVLVTWETVSEINNAGFNLYRAETEDETARTLLAYTPSQSPGSTLGASYSYLDTAVEPGQTLWYWLEAIDLHGGTSLYGPVSATLVTPTAVTLTELQAVGAAPLNRWAWAAAILAGAAGLLAVRRRNKTADGTQ